MLMSTHGHINLKAIAINRNQMNEAIENEGELAV